MKPTALSSPAPSSRLVTLVARSQAEVRPLVSLAAPLIAGLTGSTLLGVTDTYFLGPLGEVPLAAVSLTSTVMLIMYAALYGFVGPVGLLVGQAFGAGHGARIGFITWHGVALGAAGGTLGAALMGVAYFALPWLGQPESVLAVIAEYWMLLAIVLIPYSVQLVYKQVYDSINRPWTGFALTLVPVIVNIPLTWALVGGRFGLPTLGLIGAGASTLIASLIGTAAVTAHDYLAPSMAAFRQPAPWTQQGFSEQLRDGIPMAVQYLVEGGAVTAMGVLIGWLGATALAANQIVFCVSGVLYMVPLGTAGAVGVRLAQAAGAGEHTRLRPIAVSALTLVTVWAGTFTLALMIFGRAIAAAFVSDANVIAVATTLFVVVGLMQVFDGLQSVSLGALRGILDTVWPTRVSIIAYWLIAMPLGYALAFWLGFDAPGLWLGFALGLAVASVLLIGRLLARTRRAPTL
jgi:MATE family multidrug resistance protein